MQYITFDPAWRTALLPLTYTRPVAELRVGILTIRGKWERLLETECAHLTEDYLSKKYPASFEEENVLLNGAVCANDEMAEMIKGLEEGESLWLDDLLIAARVKEDFAKNFDPEQLDHSRKKEFDGKQPTVIRNLWDIFLFNGFEIANDLRHVLHLRVSDNISNTNTVIGDQLYIDDTATIEGATLNTDTGPIYIGPDAEIMEGAMIRGPFAVCKNGVVKMGAKIYGPTTIGPWCKVGGEVNNSVFIGYSNKAHDGFLGNSVIGEWCNLGADTNNSNLKNNYDQVKLWNYDEKRFVGTGLQFCGLFMGDHSKAGINTMFNTGTIVGVSANIYGSGFPRNFIPSFSWGGATKMTTFKLDKAFAVSEAVMKRRKKAFDETEKEILTHIFEVTGQYRNF